MINIAINGAAGRMGRRILALASVDKRFTICGAFESADNEHLGTDSGELAGLGTNGIVISKFGNGFDVLIDFTTPAGAEFALESALSQRACFVTGTTGLSKDFLIKLRIAGEQIGVFQTCNFSKGIAAMASMSAHWARILAEADIEIEEIHHSGKIDAPSGTALDLAGRIAQARDQNLEENASFGRHGKTGPRKSSEIGIHALRGGGTIGDHRVIFSSPFETLIIEHRAVSRDVFAAGALDAAAFLFNKTGFYSMQDLISTEGVGYA